MSSVNNEGSKVLTFKARPERPFDSAGVIN